MSTGSAFTQKLKARDARRERVLRDSALPCVLVIDDEPEITDSVAEMLHRDYRVITANTAETGLNLLRDNPVALILTDQRMPDSTGTELLARALEIAPEATRILFTGYSDITAVIDAVNQGQVYRYITKPWKAEELRSVLSQGVDRHRLVTENHRLLVELTSANADLELRVAERTRQLEERNVALQAARESIEALSRRDVLTGLASRRWLDEVLEREAERAQRYAIPFCVVMADVDHFKTINDSFGHAVGDQVLKAVAEGLAGAARMTDVVGRYGGDEFLTMLPNTALEPAREVAERMRARISGVPLTFRPEPLTTSIGVAQWVPGDTVASLVERADQALYEAKRAGRDRVAARHPHHEET